MTEPLFLDPGDAAGRRTREEALAGWVADGLRAAASGRVAPALDPEELARELAAFDFAGPRALDEVARWLVGAMVRGIVHPTHPRYLGLFNPAPTFAAECADRIAAAFNPQLAVWSHAPAAVEIDRHVIHVVLRKLGHAPGASGDGHFTSGGAEANLTALVCALTAASPDFAQHGARAFAGPPVFYASRASHLAWLKIAHMCGLGRSSLRLVATDGAGRMDAAALAGQLARDRAAGAVAVLIAATAGTTSAGAIDPLAACAEIAAGAGVWLHVDAAWGGALLASDRLRHHLAGIERADSATIDAHKWFATTMGAGMFLTRRPEILCQAFAVAASYMPSNDAARDPYVTSAQWSRRFVGARLFLTLATAGWDGYARHVERAVALAQRLARSLAAAGWTVANDSPMAVVCVEPPPGAPPPRAVVDAIVRDGDAWISVAELEGREVVRLCVTNGRTSEADIDAVARALIVAGNDPRVKTPVRPSS
ncbi:MAG TPA: pyridoxal-dependent decarboxylase [Kofleriaceae bacterium]|nr:pyridoxal-dependent decarboxylase [Kofleriaceae bacterium]